MRLLKQFRELGVPKSLGGGAKSILREGGSSMQPCKYVYVSTING